MAESRRPTAPGGPEAITPGPDGNLWFTEHGTTKIGQITTGGTIHEFPLGTASSPKNIVAGADGNLWFTDLGTNKVGRLTTSGKVTELAVAKGYQQLEGIADGTAGTIWFAETHGNSIARLSPHQTV